MIDLFMREVRSYQELTSAVRARVEQLQISRLNLDQVAGLPAGLGAKLLAPDGAKDPKRFGMISLGLVLGACGLKLVVLDDRDALARVQSQYEPRAAQQVRTGHKTSERGRKRRRKPIKASGKKRLWHGRR
jgi:hypothetical protein